MKKVKEKFITYYLTFCVYALIGWLYEVFWMWFVVPPKHFVNRGVLYGPFLPIYGFGMLILLVLLKKFMSKRHELKNPVFLTISVITFATFVFTTIIEYTTSPKILSIGEYLQRFGIQLVITNVLSLGIMFMAIKLSKKEKFQNFNTTFILVFLAIWIITTLIEYVSHFVMDKAFGVILWDYTKDFLNINKRVNWDASRNFAIGGTFLLYTVQPLLNKFLPKIKENTKLIVAAIIGIPMLIDFVFHVVLKLF